MIRAGTYIISDPCYMPESKPLYTFPTFNDGSFPDDKGREYWVDSGKLSVFNIRDEPPEHGGWHKLTFDKNWIPSFNAYTVIYDYER